MTKCETIKRLSRDYHGKRYTAEYKCWENMKTRCNNSNQGDFKHYGGRGISVCERWNNSFQKFYDDMGLRPSDSHQIDRIDNNKGYEPSNCRWAESKQNIRNRSNSKFWIIGGVVYESSYDAAMFEGVSQSTIFGWCNGAKRNGKEVPPKDGCYSEYKYKRGDKLVIMED